MGNPGKIMYSYSMSCKPRPAVTCTRNVTPSRSEVVAGRGAAFCQVSVPVYTQVSLGGLALASSGVVASTSLAYCAFVERSLDGDLVEFAQGTLSLLLAESL